MSDSIYLSGHDVMRIAHHAHWIPIGRGITRQFMEDNFPGWSFNAIHPRVVTSGFVHRVGRMHSPQHLRTGVIGLEIDRRGGVHPDDGSSASPARTASWDRAGGDRVSEHLACSSALQSTIVLHLPGVSRHVPLAVRSDLGLSRTAVDRHLRTLTDTGLNAVARLVTSGTFGITVARSTISPLARLPLIESLAAAPLPDERMAWYRRQEDLVGSSLDRLGRLPWAPDTPVTTIDIATAIRTDPSEPDIRITLVPDMDDTAQAHVDRLIDVLGVDHTIECCSADDVAGEAPQRPTLVVARDLLRTGVGRGRLARAFVDALTEQSDRD